MWKPYYETDPIYKIGGIKATKSDPQVLIVKAEYYEPLLDELPAYRICSYLTGGGMKDREYPKPVKASKVLQTAKDRAISMADSKREKKIKEGYVTDPSILGTAAAFLPLPSLAHKFEDHENKVKYPCIVQPKLDGCRCIYDPSGEPKLLSRKGEVLNVAGVLNDIKEWGNQFYLDGELYIHGMPLQNLIRTVRSRDSQRQFEAGLKYYVFDMMHGEHDERPYYERLGLLMESGLGEFDNIEIVQTKIVQSKEDADEYYQMCRQGGFEGAMVKDMHTRYLWKKRHWSTLKMKHVFDDEFEIESVTYDVSPDNQRMIAFMCFIEDKSAIFKVTPAWPQAERIRLYAEWKNSATYYNGKLLTVEYRGRSVDNLPTHAVGKAIREGGI